MTATNITFNIFFNMSLVLIFFLRRFLSIADVNTTAITQNKKYTFSHLAFDSDRKVEQCSCLCLSMKTFLQLPLSRCNTFDMCAVGENTFNVPKKKTSGGPKSFSFI